MKSIRGITTILVSILIITQAILSLLTNYASDKVPAFFENNPEILLALIVLCIFIIIVATIRLDKESKNKARPLSTSDEIDSAEVATIPSNDIKAYDVFISYSHHDADWVNKILVPKLEHHGFSVLIDAKFTAGKFGLSQIEDGVQYCKHVIAVFTPQYFKSEWATLENVMAQTLDPATRQRKLIPVLLKNSEIPLRLRVIHYRDFTSIDQNKWNLLIRDLM